MTKLKNNRVLSCWLACLVLCGLALSGCSLLSKEIDITFERGGAWQVSEESGVDLRVQEEQLLFQMDFPSSKYWTTAGRANIDNGTIEVTGKIVEGSPEMGYGLVFRADEALEDFYYFMVSGDGYVSIGGCKNSCTAPDDYLVFTDELWEPSDAIGTGLDQAHVLKVEAQGDQLTYLINGREILTHTDSSFRVGDVGMIVQTFDAGGQVMFDNLRYLPPE